MGHKTKYINKKLLLLKKEENIQKKKKNNNNFNLPNNIYIDKNICY